MVWPGKDSDGNPVREMTIWPCLFLYPGVVLGKVVIFADAMNKSLFLGLPVSSLGLLAFEAGFGAADSRKQGGGAKRRRIVEHTRQEVWQGVVSDAQAGRDYV
jgi:hypothetical protein